MLSARIEAKRGRNDYWYSNGRESSFRRRVEECPSLLRCYAKILKSEGKNIDESIWMRIESEELE